MSTKERRTSYTPVDPKREGPILQKRHVDVIIIAMHTDYPRPRNPSSFRGWERDAVICCRLGINYICVWRVSQILFCVWARSYCLNCFHFRSAYSKFYMYFVIYLLWEPTPPGNRWWHVFQRKKEHYYVASTMPLPRGRTLQIFHCTKTFRVVSEHDRFSR